MSDQPKWLARARAHLRDKIFKTGSELHLLSSAGDDYEKMAAQFWKCKAQRTAVDPQDCDWPICGCDPHADKVMEAISESGNLIVPAAQHAALMDAARALRLAFRLPRPWMDGGITWVQWDEAYDKIDAALSALKAAGIEIGE